jgi:hypothetical protein
MIEIETCEYTLRLEEGTVGDQAWIPLFGTEITSGHFCTEIISAHFCTKKGPDGSSLTEDDDSE